MNNILGTVGMIVVIAAVAGVLFYFNKKKRDESWEGNVVDKAVREHVYTDQYNNGYNDQQNRGLFSINLFGSQPQPAQSVTHTYSITVALDSGEQFPWEISSGSYDHIQIGDRVAKRAGTMTIEVVQAATQTPPTQASQTQPVAPPISAMPTPIGPVVVPPSDQQHPQQ